MLMAGKCVTATQDELRKVTEEYIYHSLVNPKPEIEARIRQLRTLRHIDIKSYKIQKRFLPYFVCSTFNPPYRNKENFGYAEHIVIDIDNLQEKGLDIAQIRDRIQKDERVLLCFESPSQDGIKVLFRLRERCYDPGIYSLFYRQFAKSLSEQYGLDQVIDTCTCDVSRACFVSVDPNAYYNPAATDIELSSFVAEDNPQLMFDTKRQQDNDLKEQRKESEEVHESQYIESDILEAIKAKLNPKANPTIKAQNNAYIPEQLNDIIDDVVRYIEETGLVVYEVINIQYAKKIRVRMNHKQAEVNLFYGKRGYNVVISPKCGTDSELNQMVADLINSYLLS